METGDARLQIAWQVPHGPALRWAFLAMLFSPWGLILLGVFWLRTLSADLEGDLVRLWVLEPLTKWICLGFIPACSALDLYFVFALLGSDGNGKMTLEDGKGTLDRGGFDGVYHLKPGWIRSVRISSSGKLSILGVWAFPCLTWFRIPLPLRIRRGTPEDNRWIVEVLDLWRSGKLFER